MIKRQRQWRMAAAAGEAAGHLVSVLVRDKNKI